MAFKNIEVKYFCKDIDRIEKISNGDWIDLRSAKDMELKKGDFKLIPLGGAVIRTDAMVLSMISYMTNLFVISFRIILPVFGCIMILNVVLGIMAKVAPQMNMFTVGVQLKILVGFTVLMLCTFLFPHVCDFVFQQMKESIVNIVGGMTP